jgi:methyl-accepting chemotaxis protein
MIAIVGGVGLRTATMLNGHTNDIFTTDVTNMAQINSLIAQIAKGQSDTIRLPGLADEPKDLAEQLAEFSKYDASVEKSLQTIVATEADEPQVSEAAAKLRAALAAYNTIRDGGVIAAMNNGDPAAAERIAETTLKTSAADVLAAQNTLSDAQVAAAADAHSASDSVYNQTRTLLIVLTLVALVLSVGIALFYSRRLTRRLRRLIVGAEAVADGDLTHRVDVQSRDELQEMAVAFNQLTERLEVAHAAEAAAREDGQRAMASQYESFARRVANGDLTARVGGGATEFASLADNMNGMVQGLGGMSSEVREAAREISGAATQILSVVVQHNAASSEQAASIAQTSVTVDEVRATAQQAAERADALAEQARSATTASESGREAVEGIVAGMSSIRVKVEQIAQDILALSDRTQAIQDITQTVNDLADQSNMLALNATIEAAKAGEHGKGFAVVANEVRALAEQSKAATARVREILLEIQQASDKAVQAAEEGTQVVESGAAGAREAGMAIERISQTVQETAQVASQIAASAKEQSVGMEQIGQAMTDVATTTHQIAQGADQTQEAARTLADLAARLDELTSRYVLEDTSPMWEDTVHTPARQETATV